MKRRGLAGNSALALAGDLATKLGGLAMIFVAARLLSVQAFAVVSTGLAAAGLLAAALDFGAGTLLTRDGAHGRNERGALFRSLAVARLPPAALLLVAAPAGGLLLGRPLAGLAVAGIAVTAAVTISLQALYRSAQDLRPEALQRLLGALLSIGLVALAGAVTHSGEAVLGALAAASLVALVPLAGATRRIASFASDAPGALRRAAPFGFLALATLAYYRSGTLVLAGVAGSESVALFTVASTVAFGLLALPNAITTALLPRLATELRSGNAVGCSRRALGWTMALTVPLAGAAGAVGPWVLPAVAGPLYRQAAAPFALLCAGLPLIAASGVIGTALVAMGRLRVLAVQVGATLAVNLAALFVLAPLYGAVGAALATLLCEAVALALLAGVARRELPGLILLPRPAV